MAVGLDFLADLICRPPRASYDISALGSNCFLIEDQIVQRFDFRIKNKKDLTLECSQYVPLGVEEYPVVIYCHGNCGFRGDADLYINQLLPAKISVVSFDFSGSGLSEGDICTLGYNESDDLRCLIDYISSCPRVKSLGLWGRSMGAATAAIVASTDNRIDAMVLDSCFLSIERIVMDVAHKYLKTVPFLEECLIFGGYTNLKQGGLEGSCVEQLSIVSDACQSFRDAVMRRGDFDIMDVSPEKSVAECSVPALFAHAKDDQLVHPKHSQRLFDAYEAEKDIVIFEGDHNSERPSHFTMYAKEFLIRKLVDEKDQARNHPHLHDDTEHVFDWRADVAAAILGAWCVICIGSQLHNLRLL